MDEASSWWDNHVKAQAAERKELAPEKKRVFDLLKKHGVAIAKTRYDGQGDNGNLEETTLFDANNVEITERGADGIDGVVTTMGEYGAGTIIDKDRPGTLLELVSTASGKLLNLAPFDWYNNEGGFGFIAWDVKKKTVTFEHNQRVESSNYEEYPA